LEDDVMDRFVVERVGREYTPDFWVMLDKLSGERYHFRGVTAPHESEIETAKQYLRDKYA
jgi:hypothetical protein